MRAIDAEKAIEVAQIKYNDWALAMAAADGRREINLCFKKQELFKAVKAVLDCVPTLIPPNEPLTLEQLREMDGEPVWCAELRSWALIYTEGGKWEPHLILPDLSPVINFPVKTHGRAYTLYRRPPEGGVNA